MFRQMVFAAAVWTTIVGAANAKEESKTTITLTVTEKGFEPRSIDVRPGGNVVLIVTRKTDSTCAKQIQIPSKKVRVDLPLNQPVSIALGNLEKGEIRFGCGMGMMETGQISVK